ncbi:TonB-dependent receptor [Burkholderia gladioli]|uniref:TonB-dependent receptor n=1 Tax=Burkholderia gladioli TaxID=28095 RepID=UPI003132CBE3
MEPRGRLPLPERRARPVRHHQQPGRRQRRLQGHAELQRGAAFLDRQQPAVAERPFQRARHGERPDAGDQWFRQRPVFVPQFDRHAAGQREPGQSGGVRLAAGARQRRAVSFRDADRAEQTIVVGDTLHLNRQWAVQGVLGTSFIDQRSYNAAGKTSSADSRDALLSPTVSLIYTPLDSLTTYASWSDSVEEGEQAPAGTANANQFMSPYRDHQIEIGAKYAVSDSLLLSLAAFRMTRPLASTGAADNLFSVIGSQRNTGVELFAQGDALPSLSVFGGVTYIDAKLLDTGVPSTNDQLVVGVPKLKADLAADFHPAFAHGLALTGAVHVESRRAATNTNNSFAAGYATFDLGLRYSDRFWGHHDTLRFQVVNLTNKDYYASVADGNIVGSPGANTAYLGMPRVFMASLELVY